MTGLTGKGMSGGSMIDIIVLTYNHLDMTKRMIESIKTSHPYQLIVVDSGSTDGTVEYLKKNAGVHVLLQTTDEFNFSRNVNRGISNGKNLLKLICNNDIEFTPGAIDTMVACTDYAEMVGPCTAGAYNPDQSDGEYCMCPCHKDGRLCGADPTPCNCYCHRGVVETKNTLNFFCVLIDQSVFDKIGYLDERFYGYGFEDDDFCRRARDAGFKLMVAPTFVKHTATTTFKADTDKAKLIKINREEYRKKWGDINTRD
jgi:GT2 family glycosyltransferase